jgi:hypothetical protein
MFSLGRSKYDDKRQIYVNRIIADNLGIKPGEDEIEFVPSDVTGEVRIRKCTKKKAGP